MEGSGWKVTHSFKKVLFIVIPMLPTPLQNRQAHSPPRQKSTENINAKIGLVCLKTHFLSEKIKSATICLKVNSAKLTGTLYWDNKCLFWLRYILYYFRRRVHKMYFWEIALLTKYGHFAKNSHNNALFCKNLDFCILVSSWSHYFSNFQHDWHVFLWN